MVEVAGRRFKAVRHVSYRVAAGKLTENHADELAPCIVALTMLVCPRLLDDLPDFFFGKKRDYLSEKS